MRFADRAFGCFLLAVMTTVVAATLAAPLEAGDAAGSKPVRKATGIEKRTLFTGSKVHGTPDPPDPYAVEVAFPKLQFDEPLAMTIVPGTNRLVVAERKGKIFTFVNDPKVETKDLLVDVGRTVYGVAIHPKFADNGYFFLTTVLDAMNPSDKGTRISRFVAKGAVPAADAKGEEVLLEWPSGGHNGGCLRFGPDGMLYVATGDGSGIADQLQTGQDLSDLLGSMLRIDVDRHDQGMKYAVPKDNPFVGMKGARPEIWSYGHRQVWKFSFDGKGQLWAAEVGQDLWEMIYLIQKGGNYGWSVQEGLHPFRPERPKGPSPILKPVIEHAHSDFRSITGGWVSTTDRLPELKGAYIYGDYDTGRIWALRYENGKVVSNRELADTTLRVVEFGQDEKGDVLAVDFMSGRIYRLVKAPPAEKNLAEFPRKLSETGLFESTKDHKVAAGLIPYSVNAPLYSDNALKDRFIALPGDAKIEFDVVVYPSPAPGSTPGWRFPDESVIVKTFSLELEAGNPKSARRLETRILHQKLMPGSDEVGEQYWRGYTYVWNDEQTDAVLLEAKGADREFTIQDKSAPGGSRKQTWHFPSRAECTLCHTMAAKYTLGLNTMQINRDHDYGGVVANQLATFEHLGLFDKKLPDAPEKLPKIADYHDASIDTNRRARSYLFANCSHCHRKWGGGNAEFILLPSLPLSETGTLDVRAAHGQFDLKEPRLIVAGEPDRSIIAHRMQKTGLGRMPHVASSVVDEPAVKLIREWIRDLPKSGATTKTGL